MPKKQSIAKANVTVSAPARPSRTTRASVSKHSKALQLEPVKEETVVPVQESPSLAQNTHPAPSYPARSHDDPREEIAQLAYSYWEARGFAQGSPHEDWIRAEAEYRNRLVSR
jgi:hypothetical protein